MSGFKLQPHDILRDPTIEELHNGPSKSKLPEAIQRMDDIDTACTFCGVSYLVFSEVQELKVLLKHNEEKLKRISKLLKKETANLVDLRAFVRQFIEATEDDLSAIVVEFQKVSTKAKLLQEINITKENDVKKMEDKYLDLHAQVNGQPNEIAKMELQCIKQIQSKEKDFKSELAEMDLKYKKEVQTLKFHLQDSSDELKIQKTRADSAELSLNQTSKDLQEIKGLYEDSSAKISMLEKELKDKISDHNDSNEELKKIRSRFDRCTAELDLEIDSQKELRNECGIFKNKVVSLEKNKHLLLEEREELMKQQKCSDKIIKDLRSANAELEKKNDEILVGVRTNEATLLEKISNLKNYCSENTESLLATHQEELEALKRKSQDELKMCELNFKVQEKLLQDKINTYSEEEKKLSLSIQENSRKVAELDRINKDFKEKHESSLHEIQRLKFEVTRLTQDERNLTADLNRLLQDKKDKENEMQSKSSEIEHSNQLLMNQHAEQKSQLILKDKEILTLNESVNLLEQKNEEMMKQMHSLKKDISTNKSIANDALNSSRIQEMKNLLKQKNEEIFLLQQTVHRECMERTSLLEKMRSSKVLPDVPLHQDMGPTSNQEEPCSSIIKEDSVKMSFYEKLRQAGPRKTKKK